MLWSPGEAGEFLLLHAPGSLSHGSINSTELRAVRSSGVTAASWSPCGGQLVVGSDDCVEFLSSVEDDKGTAVAVKWPEGAGRRRGTGDVYRQIRPAGNLVDMMAAGRG